MKAKINLQRNHGRIDIMQMTAPYPMQSTDNIATDRENKLATAYSANYSQACLLLQAIQMNGRRRLSQQCISHLANFVARAWETDPEEEKINALAQLMTNLLDTTILCPEKPFDEALKQFCRNNIPTHSVSPSITLLIAIGYIERLKQKYGNIKGTSGCGHRLIMVAYMMAAKFMHVNLRSIINTTTPTSPSPASTPEESEALPFSSLVETINPQLPPSSAERSTIRNDDKKDTPTLPPIIPPPHDQTLPSPPTSPKTYSDTDPTNYHYFKATPKKQAPPADRHFQILRMELEFLHFLNYDLTLRDTLRLIHWAQKFEEDAAKTPDYSSGDEGGDE